VLAAGAGRPASTRGFRGHAARGDVVGLDGADALLASGGGKQRPTAGAATCAGLWCRRPSGAAWLAWHGTARSPPPLATTLASKLAVAAKPN